MAQADSARPSLSMVPDHPAGAGRAAGRKWPLKWTFLFAATTSLVLWSAIGIAIWHVI